MFKLTASLVLIFSVTAFAVSPIELGIEAEKFFSQGKNQSISIKEGISYVKKLRNEIIDLGYEVPSIEDMIIQLESEFGIEIVNKEKETFSDKKYFFYLGNKISWCSEDIDSEETDWGKLAIGSYELLAGALLAIIPCGLTRKIAAGIIVDGLRRILNEAEEISENNELDQISQ